MDARHNFPSNNYKGSHSKMKHRNLFMLFALQFLLSQLVLSYGIYSIHYFQAKLPLLDILWPPVILLSISKISSPWIRDITESLYEHNTRLILFIGTILCSSGIAICSFFPNTMYLCGLVYGILGGVGSNLIILLINCHLNDLFPYLNHIKLGVYHLANASGLFITPVLIKYTFDHFTISYVFLIHGAILLHILPIGLFMKKRRIFEQKLTSYNNFRIINKFEEEMIDMSENQSNLNIISTRSWKSPSDIKKQEEYINLDQIEETSNEETPSSPLQKTNTGVNILPQIVEEDEEEYNEENRLDNKRKSIITDNVKRMSVISTKFEEIIEKNIEDTDTFKSLSFDRKLNSQKSLRCCTPYQKHRLKQRIKFFFNLIYEVFIQPLIKSLIIIEFYPVLITNIHTILSPLIFLNFIVFKTISTQEVINSTEISFMFSITAFGYFIFLITLPWTSEIPKRYLRIFYILGCIISAFGVFMCNNTINDDYMIVSCLIYGFGLGTESYLKDIVMKEFLGIRKWSKTENTLETMTGILFFTLIYCVKKYLNLERIYSVMKLCEIWFNVIMCNHLIIGLIWIIFPLIIYLIDKVLFKNSKSYTLA